MKSHKKCHPTLLEVAHEMAKDLYAANIINEAKMKEFDILCKPANENDSTIKKRNKSTRLQNKKGP